MNSKHARAVATTWIRESDLPISAAFVGGSVARLADHDELSASQDVDVYLLVEHDPPDGKIGKVRAEGVLLDISWLDRWAFERAITADDAVMASLLHFGRIVHDPTGWLAMRQSLLHTTFAAPGRIAARLASMRAKIEGGLSQDNSALPYPERVMNWLFPATLATHLPLIQASAPLTVRKRFVAAKAVMEANEFERLLHLFGFDAVTPEQAQAWLDATARLLTDTAPLAAGSQRFWAGDIAPEARDIAIGGSQELIDAGLHREALNWIIATSARCLVVHHDAGMPAAEHEATFRRMLADLALERDADRAASSLRIHAWINKQYPTTS